MDQTLEIMAMPAYFKLLTTPNMLISYAGATAHSTPHEAVLTNAKIGTENDSVAMGNGEKIKHAAMVQIKGTAASKEVQEVAKVVLKEVAHTSHSKFNLLSLTTMMHEGCNMVGSAQHLSVSKDNITIIFDIITKIHRGKIILRECAKN